MYMYKKDLALNNLPWLIYPKTKPKQSKARRFLNDLHRPLRVRLNIRVMAMKGNSIFSKLQNQSLTIRCGLMLYTSKIY